MEMSVVLPKDRTIYWTTGLSILLHAIVLAPFITRILPRDLLKQEHRPVVTQPLEFELVVSPPPNPVPTNEPSKYASTVSSKASDRVDADEESDLPHSEGISPFPDIPSPEGADGGGQNELPALPEPQADLGQAIERAKIARQSSPIRERSRSQQNPDFRNTGSVRASFGDISISTTAWDFAPYLLDLKQRIKQHWIPPLAFTALGLIHGYTKVNLRIYPDGHVEGLAVVETEGHESLHRASRNALKGAVPFRALPEDFPEEYLDITFGFYYLLPGDEEKYNRRRNRE